MQSPPPPPPRDYDIYKDCISRNHWGSVNLNTFKNWRQQGGQGPQVINLNIQVEVLLLPTDFVF